MNMTMNWQLIVVFTLVAVAGACVAWRNWREWTNSKKGSCGGGCGCASAKPAADRPVLIEQLSVRKRDSAI
jgi:hypothetical protein